MKLNFTLLKDFVGESNVQSVFEHLEVFFS